MKKTFADLDRLQVEINLQKDIYKLAIEANTEFTEVKIIYFKIKELEKQAGEIMRIANDRFGRK